LLHGAIHDCLGVLASAVRDVTLYLNPEDAALVRTAQPAAGNVRVAIADDAALQRGDLRVASASTLVDGTVRTRCAELIAAARTH
jgi:flagellar assembly protein FliH